GIDFPNGLGLDRHMGVTLLSAPTRILGGKPFSPPTTGTLMKFPAGKGRMVEGRNGKMGRPPDVSRGFLFRGGWAQGAEWLYGGVGFSRSPHCNCYHSRFALDSFGRSFAPEQDIFRVAVLDSAGNLILGVGRYGNVEDGKPLIAEGGPAETHAIGGDEVALVQANYVGVHTDRRLFIADAGNGRVLSVKLDYHVTEKVALK
ncbi:MAG: hypothetical protein ACYTGB_19385, partial [Planctomycetota bacterium]